MRIDIITLFPKTLETYVSESIIGRARKAKLITVQVHDLRSFSTDARHQKVDARQYGGGPGMVLQIEPLVRAIEHVKKISKQRRSKIALMAAGGAPFDAATARQYARRVKHLIIIAGHYEGVDERIKKIYKIEELSIGPYVLTGGELPALVVLDAVARHIGGVLGDAESIEENRYGVGVPAYTRPETFVYKRKKYTVPPVLLSGNHAQIEQWRLEHKKK